MAPSNGQKDWKISSCHDSSDGDYRSHEITREPGKYYTQSEFTDVLKHITKTMLGRSYPTVEIIVTVIPMSKGDPTCMSLPLVNMNYESTIEKHARSFAESGVIMNTQVFILRTFNSKKYVNSHLNSRRLKDTFKISTRTNIGSIISNMKNLRLSI